MKKRRRDSKEEGKGGDKEEQLAQSQLLSRLRSRSLRRLQHKQRPTARIMAACVRRAITYELGSSRLETSRWARRRWYAPCSTRSSC